MRKPKTQLRKPSPAGHVDPLIAEKFVSLDEAPAGTPITPASEPTLALTSTSKKEKGSEVPLPDQYRWRRTVRTNVDGSESKRLTIYLPEPLARRLALRAEEERRPMSSIIAEALEAHLGASSP